jgi:hypothetical protein
MNRRKALHLGLVGSAALLPAAASLAQDPVPAATDDGFADDPPATRSQGGFRRARPPVAHRAPVEDPADPDAPLEDPNDPANSAPTNAEDDAPAPADEGLPANFPTERGQVYRSFDISRYVALPHDHSEPQSAIVEWIFRRTGSSIWHGPAVSVLAASRAQLRAYHSAKILSQVEQVVERFTDAQPSDHLKLRIRGVTAADTRWRYAVATRLIPIAAGEQGQQVWSLSLEDAAMIRTQMQVYQGFQVHFDQEVEIINGQTFTLTHDRDIEYVGAPRRDSAVGLGYQPEPAKLKEGCTVRLSPLLTYEGDAVDLALDVKVNNVRKLYPTKILARREIGPTDMTIDVPEVSETRINQTLSGWKLGETLVISAGIQPGVLLAKGGFMNLRLPGTTPSKTEFLVFLDIESVGAPPPRTARSRDSKRDS